MLTALQGGIPQGRTDPRRRRALMTTGDEYRDVQRENGDELARLAFACIRLHVGWSLLASSLRGALFPLRPQLLGYW
jgi:hypothetical protein